MAKKRAFDDAFKQTKVPSEAARFNERVLQKLRRVYQADPEVDFTSILPSDYHGRLSAKKTQVIKDLSSPVERDSPASQLNLRLILVSQKLICSRSESEFN